jgi:hypothetical protein
MNCIALYARVCQFYDLAILLGRVYQIFLGPKYQNGEKYTKLAQNIPNCHEIFPIALK